MAGFEVNLYGWIWVTPEEKIPVRPANEADNATHSNNDPVLFETAVRLGQCIG
jgi:hypothetical protein